VEEDTLDEEGVAVGVHEEDEAVAAVVIEEVDFFFDFPSSLETNGFASGRLIPARAAVVIEEVHFFFGFPSSLVTNTFGSGSFLPRDFPVAKFFTDKRPFFIFFAMGDCSLWESVDIVRDLPGEPGGETRRSLNLRSETGSLISN
jgi:hypothetical protein